MKTPVAITTLLLSLVWAVNAQQPNPLAEGEAALREGKIDVAINLLTRAIQVDPKDSTPYSKRACAYCEKKDFDTAMNDCDRALVLNPNDMAANRLSADISELKAAMKPVNSENYLRLTPELTKSTLNEGYGKIPFSVMNNIGENVVFTRDWYIFVILMTLDDSGNAVTIEDYRDKMRIPFYSGPGPQPILLKPGISGIFDSQFSMKTLAFVASKQKKIFGKIFARTTRTKEWFTSYSESFAIPPELTTPPWVDLGEKNYFEVTPDFKGAYVGGGTYRQVRVSNPDYLERIKRGRAEYLEFSMAINNKTDQLYVTANDSVQWYMVREGLKGKILDLWEIVKAEAPILKPGESTLSTGRFAVTLKSLESKGYIQGDKLVAAVGGRIPNTNQVFECYSAPFTLPPLPLRNTANATKDAR